MNRVSHEYRFTNSEVAANMRLAKTLRGEDKKTFIKELYERDKMVLKEAVEYLSPEQLFVLNNQQTARRLKLMGTKKSKKKKN